MKTNHLFASLLVIILIFFLTGCATRSTQNASNLSCTTANINLMLNSGKFQKKADNFIILIDSTSSMTQRAYDSGPSKLSISKGLINCFSNSLPDNFDVMGSMRVFGFHPSETGLVYGMTGYSSDGLKQGILSVTGTDNLSDLSDSVVDAGKDIERVSGNTAVIIFSDGGSSTDIDPVASAASMKEMYGDNICIYTVLLGDDPNGRTTMEQIAAQGRCGFFTDANNLYTRPLKECEIVNAGKGMGDFVTRVFLEKYVPPPPKCILDSDEDGVVDCYDKCMNTPEGIKVDIDGCPIPFKEKISITLLVEFDYDKDIVKHEFYDDIEKVANILLAYPKTNVELEGHTDSRNTEEYNMHLSRRRAESVKKYLSDMFGINESRITTLGYGESNPVASNETDEGRQRNRRVVANIEAILEN